MDGKKVYALEVQGDFLNKQTYARPAQALAELIWNSLDADATVVDVSEDSYQGLGSRIIVSDNGSGFSHADAPGLFRHLGGSWKHRSSGMSRARQRFLHGSEGKGRLKAFALGRVVDWEVCHQENGKYSAFTISMIGDLLQEVHVSAAHPTRQKLTGVRCVISELHKNPGFLYSQNFLQDLSGIFAIYLKNYPDVQITLPAGKLDISVAIASNKVVRLDKMTVDGVDYPVELEIIGWKNPTDRTLFLCNEAGLPLVQSDIRLQVPGFNFSAYLKSPYISELSHTGMLELAEMMPVWAATIESAKEAVKKFYRELQAVTAQTTVQGWREQAIYPYTTAPGNLLEKIEREVFDIVAVKVNNLMPGFDALPAQAKKMQLRLLRQVMGQSPHSLQHILADVLALSPKKQKEFAKLLKDSTLTTLLGASRLITERLKVLNTLEALLFTDDANRKTRDKVQLERVLAANTWLFGESFLLSAEDPSLFTMLKKHAKARGADYHPDDVLLSRSIAAHSEEAPAHLCIESGGDGAVDRAELVTHIRQYAKALQSDERFNGIHSRWTFWVMSNAANDGAANDLIWNDHPAGLVYQSDAGDIAIVTCTWQQLLAANRKRLGLYQHTLESNAERDGALHFLRENYSEVLGALAGTFNDAEDTPKDMLGIL